MPLTTLIVTGAIVLVFLFFMVLLAWGERRAGGRFDNVPEALERPEASAGVATDDREAA